MGLLTLARGKGGEGTVRNPDWVARTRARFETKTVTEADLLRYGAKSEVA